MGGVKGFGARYQIGTDVRLALIQGDWILKHQNLSDSSIN